MVSKNESLTICRKKTSALKQLLHLRAHCFAHYTIKKLVTTGSFDVKKNEQLC